MTEIGNFERYIPTKIPLCCNIIEGHWTFIADDHTTCDCTKPFTREAYMNYYFCENSFELRCWNIGNVSSHNKCSKNILLSKRKEVIIDEIRCLYNKLRIIENDITTDCIRYIILGEIEESKIV